MGWFQDDVGTDDVEVAKKQRSKRMPFRFYLKAKTEKKIIFLDDKMFAVWEHNPVINGKFGNQFTCRKGVDRNDPTCPMCVSTDTRMSNRSYTAFLTVLDATGWENKKHEVVKYGRMLFPMTLTSIDKFLYYKDKLVEWNKDKDAYYQQFVGSVWELKRTSADAPRVGDIWSYLDHVRPFENEKYWYESKLLEKKMPPEKFNYREILEPISKQEMLLVGNNISSGKGGDGDGGSDWDTGDKEGGDDDQTY